MYVDHFYFLGPASAPGDSSSGEILYTIIVTFYAYCKCGSIDTAL